MRALRPSHAASPLILDGEAVSVEVAMRERSVSEVWGEWVGGMGEWHVFGALTYDQDRRERRDDHGVPIKPGNDVVKAHARGWLREGERRLGRPIEAAVLALEYQKNGWPHLHPLLRVAGGLQGNEFKVLGGTWFERHGYAQLQKPRDQVDVCEYAAKYLAKDLDRGDVLFWPLRGQLTTHQPRLRPGRPARAPAPNSAARAGRR